MSRVSLSMLCLAALTVTANAADLKPRTLDLTTGAITNGFLLLRNGTEAYVSWSEDGTVGGDKGVVFDVTTGRVVREADNGRADGRGVELLGDGWSARATARTCACC
jgi:hypothetical protein